MRNRLITTVLLFGVYALAPLAHAQDGLPPANVTIDAVQSETLVRRRSVTGEIRSRLVSALASQVEGLLIELDVDEGDTVTKGQVIARLDAVRAQIEVDRANSDVAFARSVIDQRQVELDNAMRDLERLEELDRLGSSGVSQLDEARTLVASRKALLAQAKSALTTAQGDLALAERELADMTIEAPFSGRVVSKSSEIGQWVGTGDEIVTIVSLDQLEARIDIPEDVYAVVSETMKNNEPIEMRLPSLGLGSGEEIYGQVITILPAADTLSRLFPVRIAVNNAGGLLRPGMSLNAMVPTNTSEQYITVHKDAIVRTPTGEVVYFSNDGVSAIAPIERLFAIGQRMAVRSPVLQAGMSVVTSGNERLFPGQPLNILPAPKAPDIGVRQSGNTSDSGTKSQVEGN
ncbi:MAG: efflux RND transporter periplasmic adaptor subunit [Phycisphaerales bacterium JB052]